MKKVFGITLSICLSTLLLPRTGYAGGTVSYEECQISAKSPSKGFALYHTIDKILFSRSTSQLDLNHLPAETAPEAGTLLITSKAVGGAYGFIVPMKTRVERVGAPRENRFLIKAMYDGAVSDSNDKYLVQAIQRTSFDGDHSYVLDLEMTITDQVSKKQDKYLFECEDYSKLKNFISVSN
jgi:hypothetical protein